MTHPKKYTFTVMKGKTKYYKLLRNGIKEQDWKGVLIGVQ
jgi:hypothetical protein